MFYLFFFLQLLTVFTHVILFVIGEIVRQRTVLFAIDHSISQVISRLVTLSSNSFATLEKAWQQQIDRNIMIGKTISFFLDLIQVKRDSVPADQFAALQQKATSIENEAFNTATSRDDYLRRMANYLRQIQIKCQEKQQHDQANSHADTNTSNVDVGDFEFGKSSEDLSAKIEVRLSLMMQWYFVSLGACRRCSST